MTEKNKKSVGMIRRSYSGISSFRLEGERAYRGMCFRFSGIIGVNAFSENEIIIKNHGGKIIIKGDRLFISVFERGQIEISGKIKEMCFTYGKN